MKLRDLQDRVHQRVSEQISAEDIPQVVIDAVVLATIELQGFHINHAGEVCDPRPAPSTVPRTTATYVRGQKKRR